MADNYRPMWKELGLDLDTHDALLNAVGEMYGQAFLEQIKKIGRKKCRDHPRSRHIFHDFVTPYCFAAFHPSGIFSFCPG